MKKKRKFKIITRDDITGFLFVLPFLIGFIWLFLKPLISSLVYTFHRVTLNETGLEMEYIGYENYRYAFFGDAEFVKKLITMGGEVGVKILVIMFLSIFLALLLNEKFPGRLLFRTIMFLPVIFSADAVMRVFETSGGEEQLTSQSNSFVMLGEEATGFISELIQSFGILAPVIEAFTSYASKMFDLFGQTGVQIILFIVGLQAIPKYLYEVADIEGATKWEIFWKITFPLLSPSMLLCLVYTMIECFNARYGGVFSMINKNMTTRLDYACTQSWIYAILVFVMVLIVYKITTRKTVYLD